MNFQEYQSAALRTAPEQEQVAGLMHASLGLATETGEFTSEVQRISQYSKPFTAEMHSHMIEELGDTLWYVALACEHLGVSMKKVAELNIVKLLTRFPTTFSGEAAEARADKGGKPHTES